MKFWSILPVKSHMHPKRKILLMENKNWQEYKTIRNYREFRNTKNSGLLPDPWNLPKTSRDKNLVFIHISRSGGTSFNKLLRNISAEISMKNYISSI